ncbi:MAG: ATPase, T2SS/T4P/T4SS family, partial [Thermodesulfobacteriota bacterium]
MSVRLGELLIRAGMLKPQDLERALNEQKIRGGKLGGNLVRLGLISEEKLITFLSKQFGVPPINLAEITPEPEIRVILPLSIVERHQAVPVRREGSTLLVAMSDPSNHFAIEDIRFHTGLNIKPFVASEDSIKATIDHYYDDSSQIDSLLSDFKDEEVELIGEKTQESVIELKKATEEAPVVKLVNLILISAVKRGASDIHLEPYEREFRVRFRIDGVLHEEMRPPLRLKNAIASRVKVIARLDLAERRLPQDGRMLLRVGPGREVDFRVSVLPTMFGEKIVIRILDKSTLHLDLNKLGFEPDPLRQFREGIYRPYGMVLVTGPTGSG